MDVHSRHHLRSDAVRELRDALAETFGVEVEAEGYELVELTDAEFDVVLLDGEALVWYVGGEEPALTVRGANEYPPTANTVTVDAGAVSFVSDGADVMRPGIVEADARIEPEDLVVIDEEAHGKVLAVGRSRVGGGDLTGEEGKVIDSLHHVGDDLYEFRP